MSPAERPPHRGRGPQDPPHDAHHDELRRSRALARIMDDAVRVPGTRFGLGLDAVIGLVPVVGDLAGSAVAAVVLNDAVRARVPVPVLARMGWNLLVDAGLGVVRVVGDVADAAHRANRKNVRLLEQAVERRGAAPTRPPIPGYLLAAVGLVVLPLLLGLVLGVVALVLLLRWLI